MSGEIKIVNLTPHDVTICIDHDKRITIPRSGTVARVATRKTKVSEIAIEDKKIPVYEIQYGNIEGLPEPQPGVIYIVSLLVLQAVRGSRSDVVAPDTSPDSAIRDNSGNIICVKGFTR